MRPAILVLPLLVASAAPAQTQMSGQSTPSNQTSTSSSSTDASGTNQSGDASNTAAATNPAGGTQTNRPGAALNNGATGTATPQTNPVGGSQYGQAGAALNNGANASGNAAGLNTSAGAGLDGGTGAGAALNNGAGPANTPTESPARGNSQQSAMTPVAPSQGGGADVPVGRGANAEHGTVIGAPESTGTHTTPGGYQVPNAPAPQSGPALGTTPQTNDGGTP